MEWVVVGPAGLDENKGMMFYMQYNFTHFFRSFNSTLFSNINFPDHHPQSNVILKVISA